MSDIKNIIKKQSVKKIVNRILLKLSIYYSRILKKPVLWGEPSSLSIEPTTSCNLHCPECPTGKNELTRPKGYINFELFKKIIDTSYKTLGYLLLYHQGEPFLHKEFFKLISYAVKKNIYTATSTNGHFINSGTAEKIISSGIDKIIISIDGASRESYEKYRIGGDYNTVIEGLKSLVNTKKLLKSAKPFIEVQFLVNRYNEHQINSIKELINDIGADKLSLKTMQIYDLNNNAHFLPVNNKYNRYKKNDKGEYEIKSKLPNHCWRMWSSAVITWDGKIIPCCFDKDAKYIFGSLKESSLNEIWKSNTYNDFRKKILTSRRQIDICNNCTEGLKIK
ncbi:MAG: radical SAM protein [Marinilabiliales bacterium]